MKWRSAEWSKFQRHQLVTIKFTTLFSCPVSLSSAYPFALLLLHNTKGWADTRDHLLTTSMSLATAQLTSWVPLSQRTALSTHTRVPKVNTMRLVTHTQIELKTLVGVGSEVVSACMWEWVVRW